MRKILLVNLLFSAFSNVACADQNHVSDKVIDQQRKVLAQNTKGKGFGPQSPRDIDSLKGNNTRSFSVAPPHTQMNLCNIHFHKYAEHKGGEFTRYAGNGDGKGHNTGYVYNGKLTSKELKSFKYKNLNSGDTLEVHFVYTTAQVKPGPTLGACLSDAINNPQLRVEAQVFVLVNDKRALDFKNLAAYAQKEGYYQAVNLPTNMGKPVQYAGSTTGPGYNEKGSPFQVTWSVRPKVAKVNIKTLVGWMKKNDFNEDHAHGVRNLVINPDLLSSSQS